MTQFKIVKPINFGPWTIGSKDYGPQCPSCHVPINSYAPKVGDTIEGEIVNGNYYVYINSQKQLRTGKGILFPINTNGAASTQAQSSVQFITEDHLELVPSTPPVEPEPQEPVSGDPLASHSPNNPETPYNVGQTVCWICENRVPVLVGLFLLIALIILISK